VTSFSARLKVGNWWRSVPVLGNLGRQRLRPSWSSVSPGEDGPLLRDDAGFQAYQMLEAGASCGSLRAVVVVNFRVAV
jgi:hypothetical protein